MKIKKQSSGNVKIRHYTLPGINYKPLSCILLLLLVLLPSLSFAGMNDYCLVPPYVTRGSIPPNIFVVMDNAYVMGTQAYTDAYDPTETYVGYFDPTLNYSYSSNQWVPNSSGPLSGNLLNWATMSKYDLLQYVLVGGKSRSRQTNVNTLTSMSDSTWTKTYNGCIFNLNSGSLQITESVLNGCSYSVFASNEQVDKPIAVASLSFMQKIKGFASEVANLFAESISSLAYAAPPLRITTNNLADATQGVAYTQSVTATAGTGSGYTWSISAGSLPAGITLGATGTPSTNFSGSTSDPVGTYSFTVRVTDSGGNVATRALSITVVAGTGVRTSQNYNVWVCAGNYTVNCNNPDTTPPYNSPCSPYETDSCVLKNGVVDEFWDDARFGVLDFSPQYNTPKIEECIPATPKSSFLTDIENALFIGDASNITPLVNAEYMAVNYYKGNESPGCGQTDPFENDDIPCRKNFILILSAGAGANEGSNVFTDADTPPVGDCATDYTYSLSKNACYAYNNDLRSDKSGTQNVMTYIVNTMGSTNQAILKEASAAGGGSGASGGTGDTDTYTQYYDASQATELRDKIRQAILDMLARASSGTAASVLASGEGSGANLIQAIFYPRRAFTRSIDASNSIEDEIMWIGRLSNFWFYVDPFFATSSIYEDNASSKKLDLTDDNRIRLYFDTSENKTQAERSYDADNDGVIDTTISPDIEFENLTNLWEAGLELWKRTISTDKRKIYTTIDGTSFLTGNFSRDADNGDSDNSSTLKPYFGLSTTDSDGDTYADGDLNKDGFLNATDAAILIRYTHGEDFSTYGMRSRTVAVDLNGDGDTLDTVNGVSESAKIWKLGDVLNSTPRIASWIQLNTYDSVYSDTTYREFLNSANYTDRGMVFTGANDGMLHAFKLGKLEVTWSGQTKYEKARLINPDTNDICKATDSEPCGKEIWAFIPKNVLPYLKYIAETNYCHTYTVDLTPYLFDASIGDPASGDISNDTRTASHWRTILIGGMRLGGGCKASNTTCTDVSGDGSKDCVNTPGVDLNGDGDTNDTGENTLGLSSYFAIDVTDPESPTLLWEFSHESLGFTTTGPAIVRVSVKDPVTGNPLPNKNGKWFVVFGSGPTGPTTGASDYQFLGRSDQNLKIFILNLKGPSSGTWTENADYWIKNTGMQYAFAGSILNATHDFGLDYQDDALYLGYVKRKGAGTVANPYAWTDGGIGRLVTKEDTSPANWAWSTIMDGIGPVTSAVVRLENTTNRQFWLFFGTGRYYYEQGTTIDDTNQRRLFGIKEPCYSLLGFDFSCTSTLSVGSLNDVTNNPSENPLNITNGWYIDLDPAVSGSFSAERVITDPLATTTGLVFFTTFKPYDDECSLGGKSYLWSVRYNTGGAPGTLLKGVALIQVSTGAIEQIDLSSAFTEKGDRRTTALEGVPPTAQGLSLLSTPPPVKRVIHMRER